MEEEESVQMLSNRFEVLRSRVMQRGEESGSEDRKIILREERAKKEVKVQKTEVEKKKYLREVMVKIGLKQE